VSTRDSVVVTWQETDDEGGILDRSSLRINKEVYVMSADGTNQIRLTNILENDDSPEWSREGTQIVFRSDRERECCDPSDQVWRMNADGTNQVNLSDNASGDNGPDWSELINNITAPPDENAPDAAQPVTINFDSLPTGTLVTNQFHQVKFSATGFSAGSGGPYGYDLYTYNNSGLGSSPFNAIGGRGNGQPPNNCFGGSEVFLHFPVPVNNFRFQMLNMYSNYYGAPYYTYVPYTSGKIDVYVNSLYYGTYNIDIPGVSRNPRTPFPINFLSAIQGITHVRIRSWVDGAWGGPVNAARHLFSRPSIEIGFPQCRTFKGVVVRCETYASPSN
jgi:hypothetical protein